VVQRARHVQNDFGGLGSFGGLRVASLALHNAVTVEQELRDVRQSGGVATTDAAMRELCE
jgi:hypothetical protein